MKSDNPLITLQKKRAEITADIRSFFRSAGYLEVETPILASSLIPESAIEVFRTGYISPYSDETEMFLLPSPEYYLKQLVADGYGDIFCLSRCFRNSEQTGRIHNPEFSMLEWYTMNYDYMDSLKITEDLFDFLIGRRIDSDPSIRNSILPFKPPFMKISMDEAFDRYAGTDISGFCNGRLSPEEEIARLSEAAGKLGLSTSENDSWEEIFNLIFVHSVEPALPPDRVVVLFDYPAGIPALAKPAETPGRLQRWELYGAGIELINCYTEETDYNRVSEFFAMEQKEKNRGLVPFTADNSWYEIFKNGFPECSGGALGIDRLIMLLTGTQSIEGVILFPLSDIINYNSRK